MDMKLKCSVAFPSNLEKEKCRVNLGQMGAGKTMLVSIITGLISADSGSVKWGDIERNRRFGYVSQIGGL